MDKVRSITPTEALQGRGYTHAVAHTDNRGGVIVYGLYADEDQAQRIARDLNRRYDGGVYQAVPIDFEGD